MVSTLLWPTAENLDTPPSGRYRQIADSGDGQGKRIYDSQHVKVNQILWQSILLGRVTLRFRIGIYLLRQEASQHLHNKHHQQEG